jgi:hypothetical protein
MIQNSKTTMWWGLMPEDDMAPLLMIKEVTYFGRGFD